MSFTEHQQFHVDRLLTTDFKKMYDLIPEEFKHNYYFENFLFNLAEITTSIEKAKKHSIAPTPTEYFQISETENAITTIAEYSIFEGSYANKNKMSVTLEKDGTLNFYWVFAYIWPNQNYTYNSEVDDAVYKLSMRLSEDKTKVFVEHTTATNDENPYKCYLSSIFDTNITEICRVAEAINPKTNEILFHEEFIPVGSVDKELLKEWQKKSEQKPILLLNAYGNTPMLTQVRQQQNIKDVFVGKCTIGETTRYVICWKPDFYLNEAYQESFESIYKFGSPEANLSRKLDADYNTCLVEISEDEYNNLIGTSPKIQTPQLRKMLK